MIRALLLLPMLMTVGCDPAPIAAVRPAVDSSGTSATSTRAVPQRSEALVGCPTGWDTSQYAPIDRGPLRLSSIACHGWKHTSFNQAPQSVSPDGTFAAGSGYAAGLFVGPIVRDAALVVHSVDLGISADFAQQDFGDRSSFRWDDDSRNLWSAQQDRMRPTGGWATGPMRTVLANVDGTLRALPQPEHPSGPLDGLYWLNGKGLALAQFGTRGSYYRPEHDDPEPALAYLDAASGRVLQTVLFSDLPVSEGAGWPGAFVNGVAGLVLPDGRGRVFLRGRNDWIVWTQGQAPQRFDDPYVGQFSRAEFSPNGARLLISRDLPTTTVCPRMPPCRIGPVVHGPIATMHDASTGRALWSLQGAAVYGTIMARPAFSPDGALILFGLPNVGASAGRAAGGGVAVLDARNGRVIQTLGGWTQGGYAMGFSPDGRRAWIGHAGLTVFYDVHRRRTAGRP